VLEKHWPQVKRYGNIKRVDPAELESVKLVAGGFPCQPTSYAGKRRGAEDPRWLWPEMARIIRALRPRFVLMENPPGLYTKGFGQVLGDLAVCGYDAEWDCLPAAAFGAPHLRYRIFLVAYSASERLEGQKPTGPARSERLPAQRGHVPSDADSHRCEESDIPVRKGRPLEANADACGRSENLAHTDQSGRLPNLRRIFPRQSDITRSSCWEVEPGVGRVVDGVPFGVDRLEALGDAVVPQVAEWVGRRILALMEAA
jgi:DNA (cytosine-5)-methyltransferase 1